MRKKTRNVFTKGMNKDKSRILTGAGEYLNANNARILTDDTGESSGSLSSARGNELDFEFPAPGDTWKIIVSSSFQDWFLDGTSNAFLLTINGQTASIPYSADGTLKFFEILSVYINSGAFTSSPFITSQYSDSGIVIYSTDYSNNIVSTTTTEVVLTKVTGNTAGALEVIGSTTIRDSSVIFTGSRSSTGAGQIWEVTWDSLDVPTIRLVRHVDDGFSIDFPIEAEARYEADGIRRVYWTDNNQALRSLNIDSTSAYLDIVDVLPGVDFDMPYPLSLDQTGGSLVTGNYSVSYRLKSLGGAVTGFSRFSPTVRVSLGNEELLSFNDITGGSLGVATTKLLMFRVDSIDSTFTTMDTIVCSYTATGKRYYFVSENVAVGGASFIDITLANIDTAREVPEAEVLIPSTSFSRAKTIAIKDN